MLKARIIPFHFQCFSSLQGRPQVIGHHGYAFQLMVGCGTALMGLGVLGAALAAQRWRRQRRRRRGDGDDADGWPRWLLWLTPLWLLTMLPIADCLSGYRWGRLLGYVLLGASVLSAR